MEYEYYLCHHGVKGMKWGVRKKNPYKARMIRGHAGPGRYVGSNERRLEKAKSDLKRLDNGEHLSIGATKKRQVALDNRDRAALNKKISNLENKSEKKGLSDRQKKALKIGATVVATALAAYGAKKLSDYAKDKAFKVAYDRGSAATSKYIKEWDKRNLYPYANDKEAYRAAVKVSDQKLERLISQDINYAKRASKNTISAVKTLLGKNYEMPVAELKKYGN